MGVDMLQHVNIRVRDLEASTRFYVDALGLRVGPRPPVASLGCWLYLGEHPVVHLVHVPSDQTPAAGSGAVDHIAFRGIGFESAKDRFAALGIPFREALIPRDGMPQLFVHDPDGVKIELNFDAVQA